MSLVPLRRNEECRMNHVKTAGALGSLVGSLRRVRSVIRPGGTAGRLRSFPNAPHRPESVNPYQAPQWTGNYDPPKSLGQRFSQVLTGDRLMLPRKMHRLRESGALPYLLVGGGIAGGLPLSYWLARRFSQMSLPTDPRFLPPVDTNGPPLPA